MCFVDLDGYAPGAKSPKQPSYIGDLEKADMTKGEVGGSMTNRTTTEGDATLGNALPVGRSATA